VRTRSRPLTRRERQQKADALKVLRAYGRRKQQGKPAADPFSWSKRTEPRELRRLGLRRTEGDRIVERKKR
jgi:hypothetical protein